ncbi:MAG: flagellar biosynthesis anti-sigma factor FlgM [Pseudomonadota bacterium]
MSINNINNANKPQIDAQKVAQQQTQNQASTGGVASKGSTGAGSTADSVSLTQSAQQLSSLQKKASEAPVNQEKVDKLKKAIAEGEYKVNPESLAKKIAVIESQILGIRG